MGSKLLKIFNNKKMNMDEAKEFFFTYNGLSYHMWHDDTLKYEEFNKLNIEENILETWRQEIIQNKFNELKNTENKDSHWMIIGNIIEVLFCTKTIIDINCRKLLECLNDATELNEKQKIIIMEHMAGRNVSLTNGLIYLICTRTTIRKPLHNVIMNLSKFNCTNENQERYERAKQNMKIAFDKFS